MGEQLGAVDDRHAEFARSGHVRHMLLDRGRDDQCRAVGGNPAAVLRVYGDAERFELRPHPRPLAAVEGPVAAARFAAGHRLELGKRAHARTAETGVVKPPLALGIGQGA